jgi:hypothetical protein
VLDYGLSNTTFEPPNHISPQRLSNTVFNSTKFQEMMVDATKTLNLFEKEFTLAICNPLTPLMYHIIMGKTAKCDPI